MKTIEQAGKFAFVGVINTVIDLAVLNVLVWLGLQAAFVVLGEKFLVANLISTFVAMINSFILNRQWAFKSQGKNIWAEIAKFFVITVIGMFVIHQIAFNFLYFQAGWLTGFVYKMFTVFGLGGIFSQAFITLNFSKVLAVVVSLIWNFIGYKFFVFQSSSKSPVGTADAQH